MENFELNPDLIEICFEEAKIGLEKGEIPVGCLFILEQSNGNQEILAKSHNKTNEYKSALKHAEMECINQIIEQYPNNYLDIFPKLIVLLTLEPCIMCCRIMRRLKFKAILFGAKNERFGGAGSVLSIHSDVNIKDPILKCIPDVIDTDRTIQLLKCFYSQTNTNAPKNKVRIK